MFRSLLTYTNTLKRTSRTYNEDVHETKRCDCRKTKDIAGEEGGGYLVAFAKDAFRVT